MKEIVSIQRQEAVTSSLTVAEVFQKNHNDILRAIGNLVPKLPVHTQRNFALSEYCDSTGRSLPMYIINRDGFTLLIMGFTGKKALSFKLRYIDAFNLMEETIKNRQNLAWQQARIEGKTARHDLTDAVSQFVQYAETQGSTNARQYFCNITKMTYKALSLVKAASPKPFRDMLDIMQTTFLATAEYITRQALLEGMAQQLQYKEIYQLARDRVTIYAATLPIQRQLPA